MLFFGVLVAVFVALLPAEAAANRSLEVSVAGAGLETVTVQYGNTSQSCTFESGSCSIPNIPDLAQPATLTFGLSVGGTVIISGTGLCEGALSGSATVPIRIPASGTLACGVTGAPNALSVTANLPAVLEFNDGSCAASQSSQCLFSNFPKAPTILTVSPGPKSMLLSGASACGGIGGGADPVQFVLTVPSGLEECALTLETPYFRVLVTGAGLANLTAGGTNCPFNARASTGSNQYFDCPYPESGQSVILTPGLDPGVLLSSGSGACADAKSSGQPFSITVTDSKSFSCILVTGVDKPHNGWWSFGDESGTYFALQLDESTIFGVAFTFDDSQNPVWYMINAQWDPWKGGFYGAASLYAEPVVNGALNGPVLTSIEADVTLQFDSAGTGILEWTPRSGAPSAAKAVKRLAMPDSISPPELPNHAPPAAWYGANKGVLVEGGPGLFLEMQKTSNPAQPSALAGIFGFDETSGLPVWYRSESVTTTECTATNPCRKGSNNFGWRINTKMTQYEGGDPISAKPPIAVPTADGTPFDATFDAQSSSEGSSVVHWSSPASPFQSPTTFTAYDGWGSPTSPYWLKITGPSSIPDLYVTFFPGGKSVGDFRYVSTNTKKILANTKIIRPTTFPSYASVKLSDIAGGALLAPSQSIGGDLYLSEQGLESGSPCQSISPSAWTAPSPVNSSDCNYYFRWQFAELGGVYDITYENLFSIPLALRQGERLYGHLLTGQSISKFRDSLKKMFPGSEVVNGGGEFVRFISPANGGPALADFPSFSDYLEAAFNQTTGEPTINIEISNQYEAVSGGSPSSVCKGPDNTAFKSQSYDATVNYVASNCNLTITGTTSEDLAFVLTGQVSGSSSAKDCSSGNGADASLAAFSQAIYEAVLTYTIGPQNPLPSGYNPPNCAAGTETSGANDVFSLVARDLLVGLASGFVDSTEPLGSGTYGSATSKDWSKEAAAIFSGVQPDNSFYNPWAAAIYEGFGNGVYGFQYSDYFASTGPLGNPQLSLHPSLPIELTILE